MRRDQTEPSVRIRVWSVTCPYTLCGYPVRRVHSGTVLHLVRCEVSVYLVHTVFLSKSLLFVTSRFFLTPLPLSFFFCRLSVIWGFRSRTFIVWIRTICLCLFVSVSSSHCELVIVNFHNTRKIRGHESTWWRERVIHVKRPRDPQGKWSGTLGVSVTTQN